MGVAERMRDAEIAALDLLDGAPPELLDHLVRAAALMTGAKAARINVISSEAQHAIADSTGAVGRDDLEASLCARVLRRPQRQQLVPDAMLDPRFSDSVFVSSGAITTYAAAQLVTRNGVSIGTLCIFDPDPVEITQDMMDSLEQLSEAAVKAMEMRQEHATMTRLLESLAGGSRELRRSNEHLAAFAGQVSHDVQGPLAAVQMSLQLLEEELGPDGTPDGAPDGAPVADPVAVAMLMRTAMSGAQRMRATVAGLMDFAVLGGRLEVARLDTGALVTDVLQDLSARRGRTEVVVEDLPAVHGDGVQVRAVLQNLLANAMKYAVAEHPVIRVSGRTVAGVTRLSVADNGPGVPEAQRHQVFDLMVRGDGVSQTGVDGLGIGLATCRRIVESHGGRIGVDDAPGGGADFWFELPDQPDQSDQSDQADTPGTPGTVA
ncbi:sensor histidine kinase [Nocardioides aurantiacus]|uniref:Sensor-like histidine kinase SenX3 n=1 Tax=Nocardioides aurantiacus TaxID=86796 RepID=A0A3N2CT60_9ACTN|nr:ATP-binding protein [Nocardioides aurantiacus]ROR90424.1 GAF sensor signal transduction histidine kinase [Nocardioides aurantiacus]